LHTAGRWLAGASLVLSATVHADGCRDWPGPAGGECDVPREPAPCGEQPVTTRVYALTARVDHLLEIHPMK